ncbi:hypothetical protein GmHk_17G049416 [Glycine max]|nr:hypothetical protein GmHk_17G049416 [Glycine max]
MFFPISNTCGPNPSMHVITSPLDPNPEELACMQELIFESLSIPTRHSHPRKLGSKCQGHPVVHRQLHPTPNGDKPESQGSSKPSDMPPSTNRLIVKEKLEPKPILGENMVKGKIYPKFGGVKSVRMQRKRLIRQALKNVVFHLLAKPICWLSERPLNATLMG